MKEIMNSTLQWEKECKVENRVSARYSDIRQSWQPQSAPKYHTWGLTSDPRATRWHEFSRISWFWLQDWREHRLEHKLHFNNKVRLRAGRCTDLSSMSGMLRAAVTAQVTRGTQPTQVIPAMKVLIPALRSKNQNLLVASTNQRHSQRKIVQNLPPQQGGDYTEWAKDHTQE